MSATSFNRISRKRLSTTALFLIVGSLATIFDACASYFSIASSGIAIEGNPVINLWTHFLTTLGASYEGAFASAMALRSSFGIALLLGLYIVHSYDKYKPSERKMAQFGLVGAAIALTAVAIYHIAGVILFG